MTELEKRASRMKWDPPAPGTEARKEMPKSAFLSPSTRTFPYKVLIDGQWVVSEKGLRSAISVANFRGNTMISSRASKLLEELTSGEDTEHSDSVDNVLAHFGILGMKWGVRNEPGTGGRQKITKTEKTEAKAAKKQAKIEQKQLNKAENQWINKTSKTIMQNKMKTVMEEHNDDIMNAYKELAKEGFKGTALTNAAQVATAAIIDNAWSKDSSNYSPSGSVRVGMGTKQVGANIYLSPVMYLTEEVKHASSNNERLVETEEDYGLYVINEKGQLVVAKSDTEHSDSVDNVLAHFGILGMKWGVRRETGSDGLVKTSTKKVLAEEHTRARELMTKSAKELTNKEIKELNERLNLEKNLKNLAPSDYEKGKAIAKEVLAVGTLITSMYALTQSPLGQSIKKAVTG